MWIKLFRNWVFTIRKGKIEISLELVIRNFVSILMFSILISLFLNCIVCEMDHLILDVFKIIVKRGSSNIALSKPVKSHSTIHFCCQHKMPYIKFSSFIQHWLLNILLDNKSFFWIIFRVWSFNYFLNLIFTI